MCYLYFIYSMYNLNDQIKNQWRKKEIINFNFSVRILKLFTKSSVKLCKETQLEMRSIPGGWGYVICRAGVKCYHKTLQPLFCLHLNTANFTQRPLCFLCFIMNYSQLYCVVHRVTVGRTQDLKYSSSIVEMVILIFKTVQQYFIFEVL